MDASVIKNHDISDSILLTVQSKDKLVILSKKHTAMNCVSVCPGMPLKNILKYATIVEKSMFTFQHGTIYNDTHYTLIKCDGTQTERLILHSTSVCSAIAQLSNYYNLDNDTREIKVDFKVQGFNIIYREIVSMIAGQHEREPANCNPVSIQ